MFSIAECIAIPTQSGYSRIRYGTAVIAEQSGASIVSNAKPDDGADFGGVAARLPRSQRVEVAGNTPTWNPIAIVNGRSPYHILSSYSGIGYGIGC